MKTGHLRFFGCILLLGFLVSSGDAEAARRVKTSTTCRLGMSDRAISIQSITAESARRIRINSVAGMISGAAVYPDFIQIYDSTGAYVGSDSGSQAGTSYLEFFFEGLLPGRTYKVVASNASLCASKSAEMEITMPALVTESVKPLIFDLSRTGWWGGTPALRFSATDDTAVAGYRMFVDGILVNSMNRDPASQWARGWSDSYWCLPGSSFWHPLGNEYVGKLSTVEIEVTDVFGNQSVQTRQIQF